MARALKKTDSIASEPEAIVDLEVVKQASSRVADASCLAAGDAVYDFAVENLRGFETMFPKEFQQQKALASTVSLTWASACSGSEGAYYVMEAMSRAHCLRGSAGVKLSLKHSFSCECNKDKQKWIQAVVDCGPLKYRQATPCSDDSEDSQVDGSDSCLFQDIQDLGGSEAPCVTHGRNCPVQSCDIFVLGTSCKDLSKANPKKETQKLVFNQVTSLGGSAQTFQGFTSYVKSHSPGVVVFENVDGLEDQIGASSQSNLDILLQTMKGLGYRAQPVRTDAQAFGLPARRRRLYVLFVREINPKLHTSERSLTRSFDMFNSMVASCLRSPPCAKKLLLNCSDQAVWDFLSERQEVRAGQKSQKSASSWTEQHMKFAEAEGLRWGQPYPKDLKTNGWFESLTAREQDLVILSRAQAPDAGFRNLSQSIGREHAMSFCKETAKHVAPTMLPGQILWMDLLRPPRVMLGREALLFQGFPVLGFLDAVDSNGIDVYVQPATNVNSRKRQSQSQSKKWLTENLMTDLAGNAMALPVLLAITQSAVAALLLKPLCNTATAQETAVALSALEALSALGS